MSSYWVMSASAALSFFLGAIPFSLFIAKYGGGIDLRQHGSGNVGATNVARTMGWTWGSLALAFDSAKGVAAVCLIPLLISAEAGNVTHQAVLCGIFAVLGHMFTPWLSFRGGKGVATALGAVTVLAPQATGIAFAAFALIFLISRIVSLSSISASLAFPIAQWCLYQSDLWSANRWSLGVFSILVPALIVIRHRSNVLRLWQGTEAKLTLQRKDADQNNDERTIPPTDGADSAY